MPIRINREKRDVPSGKRIILNSQRPRHLPKGDVLQSWRGRPWAAWRGAWGWEVTEALTDLRLPPGNATRHPTAVTAVISCAVDAATTPIQTAWSSGATASTTGAAMSPAAGVSARWSATSASEACPAPVGAPGALRGQPGGLETPRGFLLVNSRCQAWEAACASTWKPPGTGGPGHQRKLTRLKITWQPEALECPLVAFQADLRSQEHGFGKTSMDLTFQARDTNLLGRRGVCGGLPALMGAFCRPSP